MIKLIHGSLKLNTTDFKIIHLIGIFKRIIKLLILGVKPVFVFDGVAPELKRRTVRIRREIRENRKINLRKVAERFILKKLEK